MEALPTHYQMPMEVFGLAEIEMIEEVESQAIRPQNTTLSIEKIKNHFSLKIPLWQQSLKGCLKEIT